jgi:hypothetical protein
MNNPAFFFDFVAHGIQPDDGINSIQGTILPSLDLRDDLIGYRLYQLRK